MAKFSKNDPVVWVDDQHRPKERLKVVSTDAEGEVSCLDPNGDTVIHNETELEHADKPHEKKPRP